MSRWLAAKPVYLFNLHTRAREVRPVEPGEFGYRGRLVALHDKQVRRLLGASIFVDAPPAVCLERRIARDTVERGRSRESVLEQDEQTFTPMAERYILPSKQHADPVLSGENPLRESWPSACRLLLQAA